MSTIYTKEGRPLQVSGDDLFGRSGTHIARLRGGKAYGPDGRYVGTLVGDRLVYRSTDSASISSPFCTTGWLRICYRPLGGIRPLGR